LAGVVSKFGVPDIVLDDGSHLQSDLIASFEFFYPKMPKNGVYLAEDVHTSYWPAVYQGGLRRPDTFIEYCKNRIDDLNAERRTLCAFMIALWSSSVGFISIKEQQ
jgi:hypothetical protein